MLYNLGMIEYLRTSLEGGACITEVLCFPSWKGRCYFWRKNYIRAVQKEWLAKHGRNVFIAGDGRLYSNVLMRGSPRIVDIITGTLFDDKGVSIGLNDLRVDLSDINRDEKTIWKLILKKY